MGRPRTPTNILKLKGSDKNHPGRLKDRGKEPQPDKGQGEPPDWLSPRGRRQYRKLSKITAAMDVLTVSDHAALALLCDAWDDYWKAGEAVDQHGLTIGVQTHEGTALVKANPAVAMKADAWRRVQSGMSKFGLDPSSRANLSVTTPKERNPFDEFDDPPAEIIERETDPRHPYSCLRKPLISLYTLADSPAPIAAALSVNPVTLSPDIQPVYPIRVMLHGIQVDRVEPTKTLR